MKWEIIFYITPNGNPVVQNFINSLQKAPHAKLLREIDLLEDYGIDLGMPHAKSLGGGLYELRVRGKIDVRVFYVFAKAKNIYLLHGFVKKRYTTPKRELDIALDRKKEVENL
jgi:phage-related protein